jgi:hypothetical protein
VTVGTDQDTSPMSSEPPPVFAAAGVGPPRGPTVVGSPCSRTFMFRCTSFANAWSAALHVGSPTFWMFACIVSATVLFMCCGQADPSSREVTFVPVIMAAPSAIVFPVSHISLMCG